jgi:polysaccharide pyruvyl transferase WcaK-like protein
MKVGAGARSERSGAVSRVGLFGLFGSGNLGNDGSFEIMLGYLRQAHPDATLDAMCSGPRQLTDRYGLDAVPLNWSQRFDERAVGKKAAVLKAFGKAVDAFRIASWVRRHDVVIVPGTGILEAALRLRPWGTPYVLFLLCGSGKLFGTKVALVSVGADKLSHGLTRFFFTSAVRLASYTSYRDTYSRDAMHRLGDADAPVYPDLVFGYPDPAVGSGDVKTVGVGVMAYFGTNDDRPRANEVHARYTEKMIRFVEWLLDGGRRVRLLVGDTKIDDAVAQNILNGVRATRRNLGSDVLVAAPTPTLEDLMRETSLVGTVVASRYHNVLCALKLSKPTISIGYSDKHDALMADMDLPQFCQSCRSLDVDRLIAQFTELEERALELHQAVARRNAARMHDVDRQFALLSSVLFPLNETTRALAQV